MFISTNNCCIALCDRLSRVGFLFIITKNYCFLEEKMYNESTIGIKPFKPEKYQPKEGEKATPPPPKKK